MLRFFSYTVFFFFFFVEFLFCQWIDISPKGRKEKIYSIDLKTKNVEVKFEDYSKLTDTILAVGWSSTSGVALLTFDGGKNWNIFQFPTLFPFACQFLDQNLFVVCGYNFIYDNAEVKFLDFSGNVINSFEFNGDSLAYNKNFFDCLVDGDYIYFCGYGGLVFKLNRLNNTLEQSLVDLNKVLMKVKKFDFTTSQGNISLGFLLGGDSYTKQNLIYYSNPNLDEWNSLFNFAEKCPSVEIVDFWFYGWDVENNFPMGYVIGMCDDTVLIMGSDPKKRSFEIIFKEQSTLQPLGIYVSKSLKEIIAVFDDGKVLFSSNFGQSWTYVEERISRQLNGVEFFSFYSTEMLPEILWEKLNIFGFGIDGFVAKFEKEQSLSVNSDRIVRFGLCDRIEIYDMLGRLVAQFTNDDAFYEHFNKNFTDGIYFVVKKASGSVCEKRTYIFYKNFLNFLRLF